MTETKIPSIRSKQSSHIFRQLYSDKASHIIQKKDNIKNKTAGTRDNKRSKSGIPGFRHLWVLSPVLQAIHKQGLKNWQNFQFPHNCHISQVSMLEGTPSPSKFLPGPASYSGNAGSPPLFAPMYHPLPPCLQLLLLLWISPSAVNTKIWQCKELFNIPLSHLLPANTITASTVSCSSI